MGEQYLALAMWAPMRGWNWQRHFSQVSMIEVFRLFGSSLNLTWVLVIDGVVHSIANPEMRHCTAWITKVPRRILSVATRGAPSVLFGQHDGEDPQGHVRVARVFGAHLPGRIVVVDFPEELMTTEFERTEVVLVVGIVVLREVVE